jgi:hypothetical protein
MTLRKHRAQDPLTAALSDIFLPAVRPLGFDRPSARLVVRISDGILQLLNFSGQVFGAGISAWTTRPCRCFCRATASFWSQVVV